MKTLYFEGKISKIATTVVLSKITKKAFNGPFSPVVFKKLPDPKLPADNWIRIKNIQTGICGSDMTFYTCGQTANMAFFPIPTSDITYLGHETVGQVCEIGKGVKKLKVGDRVVMNKYLQCCALKGIEPQCDNCKSDHHSICKNYGEPANFNVTRGAGFGTSYIAPEEAVVKIDKSISDDQAIIIEPAAVSLHSVFKELPKKGDKVLVVGAGMIGLNVIQFAKVLQPDCKVYVLERVKEKQELAKKLGADEIITGDPYVEIAKATGGKLYEKGKNRMLIGGFDIVYDSVGKQSTFNDAIRWVAGGGTYVKIGYQMKTVKFDETPIWWQGINIKGVDSYGVHEYEGKKYNSFDLVIKLLKEGKITLDGFITHKFKLKDYKKAFYTVLTKPREVVKVAITVDDDSNKK